MSIVNVTNIQINNNPAQFTAPLSLSITFECLKNLSTEIEWKLIYVGSSNDESCDQELESFSMGPLDYGVMQFDLETEAPDPSKIPEGELIGVTALILSSYYKGKEFFRIGYYVYNNYTDPVLLENPPEKVKIDAVYRNILADKPRITRFEIEWEEKQEQEATSTFMPDYQGADSNTQPFLSYNPYQDSVMADESRSMQINTAKEPFDDKLQEDSNNPFFSNGI